MVTCAQCGIRVDDGDDKCFNCGAPILTDVIPIVLGSKVEKELTEANLLRLKGRFIDAISACAEILRNNPENAAAHALLGDIYVDQQNYREALGWYKLAVKLEPLNENYKKKVNSIAEKIFGTEAMNVNKQKNSGWSNAPIVSAPEESLIEKFKKWILSLPPAVIITVTTIIFAVIGVIVVITAFKPTQPTDTISGDSNPAIVTETNGAQPPPPDSVVNNPADNNLPKIIPPNPDITENGDIPGLPGIKVDNNTIPAPNVNTNVPPVDNNSKPASPPSNGGNNNLSPLPKDNSDITAPPPSAEVAPLKPSDFDKPKTDWKSLINSDFKTQTNIGVIDRVVDKDGKISVEYHVSDNQVDINSKKRILFTTQWLLYSLIQHGYAGGEIILNCSAPDKLRKTRTTAFFTTLSKEQAKNAITARDYNIFVNSIGKALWRDDYIAIRL